MNIIFKDTEDGSATLYNEDIDECYHSIHGARAESLHIFLENGLKAHKKNNLSVLEIGFGTGLNALLTAIEAERNNLKIVYHTIELYPLNMDIILNILPTVREDEKDLFLKIHNSKWEEAVEINDKFCIYKHKADITSFDYDSLNADIVYFDAFSPEKQPELWSEDVFEKIFSCMNENSILTTYCSKGIVRRAMQSVGFKVEKLQGPAHKRHITRATKNTIKI